MTMTAPFGKNAPPHIPSMEAVVNYVNQKFPDSEDEPIRRQLCTDTYACEPWSVEPFLLKELMKAKQTNNQEEIKKLRTLMRAVSWQQHLQLKKEDLLNIAKKHIERINKTPSNATDKTYQQSQSFAAKEIVEAIIQEKKDGESLPACEAIEEALINAYRQYEHVHMQRLEHCDDPVLKEQQEQLIKQLLNLRTLRDQLYFQALFDDWYL